MTALGLMACATVAHAHITFENAQATQNSTIKAVIRVPHGCEGTPTVRVRIQIPDGVLAVKPQPKPGWELTVVREKLAAPIKGDHGATISEVVREVAWSGGRLPDDQYDEFAFRAQMPDRSGVTIYFPTVQECEKGIHRWIEIPAAGRSRDDYPAPAPQIQLIPRR